MVRKNKSKEKLQRNRLIRRGLSLGEIAKRKNITREAIRQHINRTGQYEQWRQSRFNYKNKTKNIERLNALEIIASQIKEVAKRKVLEKDKWAYEKAEEFFTRKKYSVYQFNTIFSLLKDYHESEQKREKVSLEKFAEKYDLWTPTVGRIFKEIGLIPLVKPRNKKRVVTPKNKKQALERSIEIEMSAANIAHFLELPNHVVSAFFYSYGGDKERPEVNKWIKKFGRSKTLTYGIASEIYEAQSLEFTDSEILELLDIEERIYDYATEHRSEIEPTIINALEVLYPSNEVKNPYIDFSIDS